MPDFAIVFGRQPIVTASAPGRVNVIGEHTDYNGGYVLPIAIPQRSVVELAPRDDDRVRVVSDAVAAPANATPSGRAADAGEPAIQEYRLGAETPVHAWVDYVQGCTRALREGGHTLGGFDAAISSTVPIGAGVSSSAALEVSLLRAVRRAFGLVLDDVALALVGHHAEHDFVGARVGVMDQMAASLADQATALFLDTRSLAYERVPIPDAGELIVIDSGIPHAHASGAYNTRRAECERACALLGVTQLRDLGIDDVPRVMRLPEPLGRRARHVITENARVLAAVDALRRADLRALGTLLGESHASMRDDYEVSLPEIDVLVELGRGEGDVYGARLTGGGFGGSIVALARAGSGPAVVERVAGAYGARTGRKATALVAGRGAGNDA
jgi:galactokinase